MQKRFVIIGGVLLAASIGAAVAIGAGSGRRAKQVVKSVDMSARPILNLPGDPPGLKVEADPAPGEELLHATVKRWFDESQAAPPLREEHFAWITDGRFNRPLQVVGWNVKIEKAQATPTGWISDVKVTPRIEAGQSVTTCYAVQERYESANGKVSLVAIEAVPGSRQDLIFD